MRKHLAVAALVLGLPLTALAQPSATQAGRARDALDVDPAHHQVILDNEHVRVIRGIAAPGSRSPMHSHSAAVLVSLGTSRSRVTEAKGGTMMLDLLPGQVMYFDGAEHSWQMIAGALHVVGVEIKAAARGTPPAAITLPETDAVKVDPVVHQVLIDNPYVRVLEGLAGTGRKSPMHSHSYGLVIISFGRARLSVTEASGNSFIVDLHPTQVVWLPAGSHSWEIVAGQHNAIAVEVKSAVAK